MFRSSTGRRSAANLRALQLGALLAHEVHTEKRGVAHVHARSGNQIAQHAAPSALAVGGAVALQPAAAVSNQRVAQEDSFRERGVAQRRQQAVGARSRMQQLQQQRNLERNDVFIMRRTVLRGRKIVQVWEKRA